MILYFATFSILIYFHFRIFFPVCGAIWHVSDHIEFIHVFPLALFSLLFPHVTHLVVATNILLIYEMLKPVFSVLLSK